MPRVFSPAGEQLAFIGEAISDDVETYEVAVFCEDGGGRDCEYFAEKGNEETLRFTRDGKTWELTARAVED